jgi:hypothetical protein
LGDELKKMDKYILQWPIFLEVWMVTDWIQAICAIIMVVISGIGLLYTIPKPIKTMNKEITNLNEQWKRVATLYAKDQKLHEYSNLDENTEDKEGNRK